MFSLMDRTQDGIDPMLLDLEAHIREHGLADMISSAEIIFFVCDLIVFMYIAICSVKPVKGGERETDTTVLNPVIFPVLGWPDSLRCCDSLVIIENQTGTKRGFI